MAWRASGRTLSHTSPRVKRLAVKRRLQTPRDDPRADRSTANSVIAHERQVCPPAPVRRPPSHSCATWRVQTVPVRARTPLRLRISNDGLTAAMFRAQFGPSVAASTSACHPHRRSERARATPGLPVPPVRVPVLSRTTVSTFAQLFEKQPTFFDEHPAAATAIYARIAAACPPQYAKRAGHMRLKWLSTNRVNR